MKVLAGGKPWSPPSAVSWLSLLLITCTVIAAPVFAEVYKWVDDSGRTHYSDKPHNEKAKSIQINKSPDPDPLHNTHVEKQRRLLKVFNEERQEAKQRQAAEKTARLKREASCSRARKSLQAIKNARFLYKKSTDPRNPIVFSYKQRNKIIEVAKKAVQQRCK